MPQPVDTLFYSVRSTFIGSSREARHAGARQARTATASSIAITHELSAVIRDIALEEHLGYLPLHEALLEQIKESPGRPFTEFRFLPFYRDAFRTLVLRKTPDEVARINGWCFHTDGVHLNSRSGLIVADLVQRFIENTQSAQLGRV